ncbi:hypothetical protein [Desulfosporosinus fructosivorans]
MDDDLARKHYRAAYALDPTFKPAIRNLERISTFDNRYGRDHIDFGDQPEGDAGNPYEIVYDKNYVEHLMNKEKKDF